jgi:hypothetical protein
MTLASCGGASSGTGNGTGPTVHTTPPGTYNITIQGTGTSVAIQQTVTLVVQ